ncbi:dihydrofolate reductase family protein [Anaeromicrobium sediminis]|uniref:Riboflavin biosynthesis protein RibD n=1 Tax=Anaeromicrobium sediminis TaxID=1478221 RepID=A0A267MLD2_9FIRM|nr:dihydrofolate reductase family protein [Anaeromicrobium sediminis]PAB60346.1 riboflavin biosynthesis protein RibD [Anaeromicrobium sediminis]
MTNRKVILYIAESIDGHIARRNGEVDWLSIVEAENEDYGYEEFYQTIDTILMGRKTYEQVLSFGEFPYKGKKCYVFSSKKQSETENVQFIDDDVLNFIKNLKNEEGKDIWIVGGSELIESFILRDLIDEYIVSIIPIILGEGIPLFKSSKISHNLKLIDVKKYPTGLVQVHYRRKLE